MPFVEGKSKPRRLSRRQEVFVDEYLKHGNGLRAYQTAGYDLGLDRKGGKPGVNRRVWGVLHGKAVQHAIEVRRAQELARQRDSADYKIDRMRDELWRLKEKAEGKGDLAVATRNVELLTKTIGGFNNTVTLAVEHRYSEQERQRAEQIGDLLLMSPDAQKLIESMGDDNDGEADNTPDE